MINLVKIARLLVSILFIFSGISKIISLDFFDGLVAELLIGPEFYDEPGKFIGIQIFTRVLISFEIMQGVALLQNWKIRKLIIPSILLILVLFTIHLFYEGFNKGFDGNCGCFGDVLPLSNGASIIKNIVAMLLAGFVWKNYIPNHKLSHFPSWVASATIAAVTLFTLSFGVKDYSIIKKNEEPKVEIIDTAQSIKIPIIDTILEVDTPAVTNAKLKIDNSTTTTFEKPRDTIKTIKTKVVETKPKRVLTPKSEKTISLLENYPRFSNGSTPDFRNGTYLIGMFSMDCSHCKEVIKTFCDVSLDGKLPKQYLFNFGSKRLQDLFFAEAMACDYPYILTSDYVAFKRLLEGNSFPRVLVIKNGEIVKEWNVDTFSETSFRSYFGIKKKVAPIDPLNPAKKEEEKEDPDKKPWE